jgi:hypothetical protein
MVFAIPSLEAVDQLCKENGLYSKLIWHPQPDNTNVLKLASQVIIFDRAGLTPKNFFWNEQGISDDTMKTGRVENPEYSYSLGNSECYLLKNS